MAVALVYFVYLGVIGMFRQWRVSVISVLILAAIVVFGMGYILPLIYLLVGYWLPALLVRHPNVKFEQALLKFDHRIFGHTGLATVSRRAPRAILEYLELAYLFCYAVVPVGFAWLVLAGYGDKADIFWSTVLLASFACYGLLPWLATRAPRTFEARARSERSLIRHLNECVLSRGSVQWNTFPSGHTAASLATALAVGNYVPAAGLVLGFIAVSIAIGSVVGRYHYAADAIAAAVFAVAAFLMASVARVP